MSKMNQPDGGERFLWLVAIVLIPSFAYAQGLFFCNDLFVRTGPVLILIALAWFSGKRTVAEGKLKKTVVTENSLKHFEEEVFREEEVYRWLRIEILAATLGTLIWGFGDWVNFPLKLSCPL